MILSLSLQFQNPPQCIKRSKKPYKVLNVQCQVVQTPGGESLRFFYKQSQKIILIPRNSCLHTARLLFMLLSLQYAGSTQHSRIRPRSALPTSSHFPQSQQNEAPPPLPSARFPLHFINPFITGAYCITVRLTVYLPCLPVNLFKTGKTSFLILRTLYSLGV